MNSPAPSDRVTEAFRRFVTLLPTGQGLDLVILKGHLLMEEQVRSIVRERVRNNAPLAELDLTCHQCICFAQSLFAPSEHEWVWLGLKKLNNIRNLIAHQVEPVGLGQKLHDFFESVPSLVDEADQEHQLSFALWSLFVGVADLVERPAAQVIELVKGRGT